MLPSVKLVRRDMQHVVHLVRQTIEHELVRTFATLDRLAGIHRLHRFARFDVWHVGLYRLAGRRKRFHLFRRLTGIDGLDGLASTGYRFKQAG